MTNKQFLESYFQKPIKHFDIEFVENIELGFTLNDLCIYFNDGSTVQCVCEIDGDKDIRDIVEVISWENEDF